MAKKPKAIGGLKRDHEKPTVRVEDKGLRWGIIVTHASGLKNYFSYSKDRPRIARSLVEHYREAGYTIFGSIPEADNAL